MTTIRMATDVIDSHRGQLDPQAARSSELLSQEVGRFEALLAELLEVSRFDAGAATLNPDDINLAKLTADEIRGVLPLAQGSGSQVSLNAPDEEMAELDGTRVRRIVRNLLTNAIEHGEGGPVEVSLAGNETSVALTVRDYGVGLSEADVRQVFDRFWRADPARNRRIGGIGLGLAIAQEDARLHGGRLGVWGAPGVGAQFRLWLPRKAGGPLGEPPLPLAPADGEGVEYEP
jgi:two-component system sensor histidine kinase MtrB